MLKERMLEQYIPGVERMQTQMRKYDAAYKALQAENTGLKKQVNSSKESIKRQLEVSQQLQELEDVYKRQPQARFIGILSTFEFMGGIYE